MSSRPSYSDEFKADAVALAASSGRPVALVAAELGISLTALKRWIKLGCEGQEGGGLKLEESVDTARYKAMEVRLRELERENDFLKSASVLRQRTTVDARYRFVQQEENAGEKVAWMCRQLGVPRSSYYRWKETTDTPTTIRHRELTDQVKTVFDSSDGIFGHRMVHAKLSTAGVVISVGTVDTIMAENGWAARRMRAFKRTTIPSDPEKVFKDLIGRHFTAAAPGTRLVGDITYLRTGARWLYLATVIDLCTRMIVGWAMADHMRASLCVNALTMARDRGHLQ